MAKADPMAEMTAEPKVIKEEEDMDIAADDGLEDDATQLLAEGIDAGSANGGQAVGLEDLTCPICQKVYKTAITLRMHLRNIHAEGPDAGSTNGGRGGELEPLEDRTCPICKKVSKSAVTLRMHLRNVHINAGPMHVCELCGASYKGKNSLEKHMKGVHQENRERDAICDVSFTVTVGIFSNDLFH